MTEYTQFFFINDDRSHRKDAHLPLNIVCDLEYGYQESGDAGDSPEDLTGMHCHEWDSFVISCLPQYYTQAINHTGFAVC